MPPPPHSLDGFLLPGHSKQHKGRTGHEQDAAYGEQHGAVVTSLGQVETTGIDHGQRGFRVGTAVVREHIDLLAADGCGSGQALVLQVLLRHILQIAGVLDDFCIPGIILDQAQNIGGIDVAQIAALSLGNDHLDVLLQQDITIVSGNLVHHIGVILQTLDDDLAPAVAGSHRDKAGCVLLVGNMVG